MYLLSSHLTQHINLDLFNSLMQNLYEFLPIALGIIVYIMVAWITVRIIVFSLRKILKVTRLEHLSNKLNDNDILRKSGITFNLTPIVTTLAKWFLVTLAIVIGADIFGLSYVSIKAGEVINYFPKIVIAITILAFGFHVASIARKNIGNVLTAFKIAGSKIIGGILFYGIVFITIITSLAQAGIDTSLLTNNFIVLLGAVLFTISLAIGFGAKDIVHKQLLVFYTRKNLSIGQIITIGNTSGKIIAIDHITLTIELDSGDKKMFPIEFISEQEVIIHTVSYTHLTLPTTPYV